MAKQTFTTGQVLTAAQMTSLQQTAMLGGSASAKTASYTLVLADAGTAISMTSTSSTTVTVNTGLFAAGDTVQITNLGTGVCTITAGTATVNPSGALALAQFESGTLNFTSASAAIFIKGSSGGGSAANLTQVATGSLSGASVTVTGLTSYSEMYLTINSQSAQNTGINLQINGDTGSNYRRVETYVGSGGGATSNSVTTSISLTSGWYAPGNNTINATCQLYNTKTAGYTSVIGSSGFPSLNLGGIAMANFFSVFEVSANVTDITILCDNGTFSSGTYRIWAI